MRGEPLPIPDPTVTPWVTVEEGGKMLAGLSRSASYAAARRGDLPVIKVGRRYVVPVARLRSLLGIDNNTPSDVDVEREAAALKADLRDLDVQKVIREAMEKAQRRARGEE